MIITKKQRKRMDEGCIFFTKNDVEFAKTDEPFLIVYEITVGATSGLEIFLTNAPFKFEILDVIIQPRGASAGGIMTLKGAGNITDAITCAVDKTIGRAGTIDDVYSTIEKNGTLEVVCGGNDEADTIGLVVITAREVD